jgi:hypothetical protein
MMFPVQREAGGTLAQYVSFNELAFISGQVARRLWIAGSAKHHSLLEFGAAEIELGGELYWPEV